MFRHFKRVIFLAIAVSIFWMGTIAADSGSLGRNLIRLHVVAASDSYQDQQVKLDIRDAVLSSLNEGLEQLADPKEAYDYIEKMLPALKKTADQILRDRGFSDTTSISLGKEPFPIRRYDTFTLPSGVYQSLRIIIGEGNGHNWWCVVFPQLCTQAASECFQEAAAEYQIPERLSDTLTGEYEVRFWILDKIGELEKYLFQAFE